MEVLITGLLGMIGVMSLALVLVMRDERER